MKPEQNGLNKWADFQVTMDLINKIIKPSTQQYITYQTFIS
jgi:hypothetical protein